MYHNRGDLYTVLYPFDDMDAEKLRPAIIFDTKDNHSLVIKLTSHEERHNDSGDVSIIHWKEAGLSSPSVARCSDFVPLHHDKIKKFLGTLRPEDMTNVLEKIYRDK
ncbi:hypothetical protein GC101_20115 [Paenibacillus sp. LMG 31459]|uniref:Growth inhibitor PemK n=1 Tax=Paenibacillus phytohabitans TaxID=2654978 RepID=A0ABX1YJP6_9BACL|nr:type II toxin-antitoxin system PemK/MazF family toxin [Paenibacillus phytohabitans]NOU81172.1 hypothetical protein [Paenibacillus phytohabitans]